MKTAVRLAAVMVAVAGSAGCIAADVLVRVKGDGSGTVEKTLTMNPAAMADLAQTMKSAGAKSSKAKDPATLTDKELLAGPFDPEILKSEAARMGEGVTFVSATPIREKERVGVKAVFAFKDVNTLKVSQKVLGESSPMSKPTPADDMKFTLVKKGGRSVLTLKSKGLELKDGSTTAKPKATPPAGMDQMAKGMMEMVKPMLKGLRVTIGVEVDGTVVKTNSRFAEGNRVTFLDLDFSALLADEKALQKFSEDMGGSVEQQKAALAKVPGMKVHLEPEMVVEFQAR
jgi:hypothetical protein